MRLRIWSRGTELNVIRPAHRLRSCRCRTSYFSKGPTRHEPGVEDLRIGAGAAGGARLPHVGDRRARRGHVQEAWLRWRGRRRKRWTLPRHGWDDVTRRSAPQRARLGDDPPGRESAAIGLPEQVFSRSIRGTPAASSRSRGFDGPSRTCSAPDRPDAREGALLPTSSTSRHSRDRPS